MEVLVTTLVFLIIAVGLYNAFVYVNVLSLTSRQKMTAIALANEQLEIVRNLPYTDVGLIAGAPAGKLLSPKTINRNGLNFLVATEVRTFDDPFDGTISGQPNDLNPADYKFVKVEITCPTCRNFTAVILETTVSPKNLETD